MAHDRGLLLLERAKLVGEGTGAVGEAVLLAGKAGGTGPAIPVLSAGNIDPTMLISVMRHGPLVAGRNLVVRTQLADHPAELIKLPSLVDAELGNVISVEHHREGMDILSRKRRSSSPPRDARRGGALPTASGRDGVRSYTVERL